MSWQCSSTTNAGLIKNMLQNQLIKTTKIYEAMLKVDRKHFVTKGAESSAYRDAPQSIGYSATISAPHMHAWALELLHEVIPNKGGRVLDVGSGSGYLCACLAELVGDDGVVIGQDIIPELVEFAKENLQKNPRTKEYLETGKIQILKGDGWKGHAPDAPYHAIHVGAAAATLPQPLVDQLVPGGRLIIPLGTQSQQYYQIDKNLAGKVIQKSLFGVRYVPLVKQD